MTAENWGNIILLKIDVKLIFCELILPGTCIFLAAQWLLVVHELYTSK